MRPVGGLDVREDFVELPDPCREHVKRVDPGARWVSAKKALGGVAGMKKVQTHTYILTT